MGASARQTISQAVIPADPFRLWMRRYRDFLWISRNDKRIYLNEQKGCLALYFPSVSEMMEYIGNLMEKGSAIDEK